MINFGIVGGGPGSMIGDVHRVAAEATGKAKLACGVFSSDYNKSTSKAEELGLDSSRVYRDVDEMLSTESELPVAERMTFLIIATPNHLHVAAAIKAIKAGFHVICDKPLGINLNEAKELETIISKRSLKFGMTYTYRGYDAIKKFIL